MPGEEEDGLPPLSKLGLTEKAWDYLVAAKWGMSVEELRTRTPAVKAEYRLMYRVMTKIDARREADRTAAAAAAALGAGR